MRRGCVVLGAVLVLLLVLWLPSRVNILGNHTRLELTDAETGRKISAPSVRDGEEIVLTWRNSLFDLMVTEVFVARDGRLDLTQVTFGNPEGGTPPAVSPKDLDDLYHTGGPFRATGLSKPFTRIVFRVGEIGDPRLKIGQEQIRLVDEVGFGGAVLLVVHKPGFLSLL